MPDRVDPDDAQSGLDGGPMDAAITDARATDTGADVDSGVRVLRVFVTSSTKNGNLGGLAGGDKICNDLALAAGLSGVFSAWLSDNGGAGPHAINRVTSPGPWRLVSGEVVAATKAVLSSGAIAHAIDHDEKGVAVAASKVWTGTGPNGLYLTNDCDKWTTGANGRVGITTAVDASWTSTSVDGCGQPRRLYCFQL